MRLTSLFRKSLVETFRDWKILILVLSFAPFFILIMHVYYSKAPEHYRIVVVDQDEGASAPGGALQAGRGLIAALSAVQSEEGGEVLQVVQEAEIGTARRHLENRNADLVLEIPRDFSRVLFQYRQGSRPPAAVIRTYGDPSNIKHIMAGAWCDMVAYQYAAALAGTESPVTFAVEAVSSGRASLTEFQLSVPPILTLALMMLMFTGAAALIREKDRGTLVRLRISNMRVYEWLTGESLTQIILGLLALALTFLTAVALGYETSGSLFALMAVGSLTSLSIMAISVLVASFIRTVFDLWTVGCFPFFILMFFSGGMFPLPDLPLFGLAGRTINAADLLPTTHALSALSRILNGGAGLGRVAFELGAISLLTAMFFALGIATFARRHMRAA